MKDPIFHQLILFDPIQIFRDFFPVCLPQFCLGFDFSDILISQSQQIRLRIRVVTDIPVTAVHHRLKIVTQIRYDLTAIDIRPPIQETFTETAVHNRQYCFASKMQSAHKQSCAKWNQKYL